jgi:LDH2 family malate/lactate/ureidoglycolate dehydrogenase
LISAIVEKGRQRRAEADLVADHLVRANLMGHDSHRCRHDPDVRAPL